jgi:hypothetical protein
MPVWDQGIFFANMMGNFFDLARDQGNHKNKF